MRILYNGRTTYFIIKSSSSTIPSPIILSWIMKVPSLGENPAIKLAYVGRGGISNPTKDFLF